MFFLPSLSRVCTTFIYIVIYNIHNYKTEISFNQNNWFNSRTSTQIMQSNIINKTIEYTYDYNTNAWVICFLEFIYIWQLAKDIYFLCITILLSIYTGSAIHSISKPISFFFCCFFFFKFCIYIYIMPLL